MTILRLLPRFRRAYRELSVLEARENWSHDEIESWQRGRLNELWEHAVAHVPYYRELASSRRLPPRFASLAEFREAVPPLAKSNVQERRRDLLSAQPRRGRWVSTSGSTGPKTTVFWADEAHREMLRGKYRFQTSWGLDIFDRAAFLWGHDHTLRQRFNDWLRNRIRLSAYRLGRDDLRRHLHRLACFRPASLYAYSTAAYLLAEEAREAGARCDSLRVVTLTSEPVLPHIVRAVEGAFGAPAVTEYGSLECGFIACEGRDRVLRVREDLVLLETTPRDDGRHDILVTVLNNPAFPLLRYSLGDVTDAPLLIPERGFAVLRNVAGRDNDLLVSRRGVFLHTHKIDLLFERMQGIRRWHIQQDATGAVTVLLELSGDGNPPDGKGLQRHLGELVEGYPVSVRFVSELPGNPGGKHRWIVSDLGRMGSLERDSLAP